MKPLPSKMELYRQPYRGVMGDAYNGALVNVPLPTGERCMIIFSDGGGWDHVSVSLKTRCPTWEEMCHVRDIFFMPEEYAVQYHPPKSLYRNIHPFCLHLWRPHGEQVPMPPIIMIG